jgi:hypothetical protein
MCTQYIRCSQVATAEKAKRVQALAAAEQEASRKKAAAASEVAAIAAANAANAAAIAKQVRAWLCVCVCVR